MANRTEHTIRGRYLTGVDERHALPRTAFWAAARLPTHPTRPGGRARAASPLLQPLRTTAAHLNDHPHSRMLCGAREAMAARPISTREARSSAAVDVVVEGDVKRSPTRARTRSGTCSRGRCHLEAPRAGTPAMAPRTRRRTVAAPDDVGVVTCANQASRPMSVS
eukprot:CAMPEP_0115856938 /NCGR_PEP_ID=MMETSP0287-20121206/15315_1 /TAXON_ID=412157 /ORGANISM="Chrysochromulina rotalis, Strain UIO044" /LENGTH=164 /DNA_ID=CAMNT_0003311137 /DNA_START=95 /DNA_END=587 /DNA_ORIENTATION=+